MFYCKLTLALLLFCALPHWGVSQTLFVEYANKTKLVNGKPLVTGANVPVTAEVIVQKSGSIRFKNYTGWSFELKEGVYQLDSCYRYHFERNTAMDSVFKVIQETFPNGLDNISYQMCLIDRLGTGCTHDSAIGNLYIEHTQQFKLVIQKKSKMDTCTISWVDPLKKSNRYFIEIKNLWGDYLDYKMTNSNAITLDISRYNEDNKDQVLLSLVIYSDDRRRSRETLLNYIVQKE